jgi:hypothetical protein
MSEQRIDHAAAAAVDADADATEGQGLGHPGAHGDMLTSGAVGETGDQPVPAHGDRAEPVDTPPSATAGTDTEADTEGERYLKETTDIAEQQQGPT